VAIAVMPTAGPPGRKWSLASHRPSPSNRRPGPRTPILRVVAGGPSMLYVYKPIREGRWPSPRARGPLGLIRTGVPVSNPEFREHAPFWGRRRSAQREVADPPWKGRGTICRASPPGERFVLLPPSAGPGPAPAAPFMRGPSSASKTSVEFTRVLAPDVAIVGPSWPRGSAGWSSWPEKRHFERGGKRQDVALLDSPPANELAPPPTSLLALAL